jgi:hypothetical protein
MILAFLSSRAINLAPGFPSLSNITVHTVTSLASAPSTVSGHSCVTGKLLVAGLGRDHAGSGSGVTTLPIVATWNGDAMTSIDQSAIQPDTQGRGFVFMFELDAADIGAFNLALSADDNAWGKLVVFIADVGVAWSGTVDAFDSIATEGSSSAITVPAVTTLGIDRLAVAVAGSIDGSGLPMTLPSGWVLAASGATGALADTETCAVLATLEVPAAGAVNFTGTLARAANDRAAAVAALAP